MRTYDYPIIDAHTHIFPDKIADKAKEYVSDFYDLPMYTKGTVGELIAVRTRTGITKQLICSPACVPQQTKSINNFIAKTCKEYAGLIGYGSLHKENKDYIEEIARMKELGLKGVKFHSDFQGFDIDDPKMIPIYKEIAKNGLPILFHMGDPKSQHSLPERLYNLLKQIPDLKVTAAHMGGYMHWEEAYKLPCLPNLYFDCSSTLAFIKPDYMLRMLERFGTSQFFFGTDFPMWQPEQELERFEALGLGEQVTKAILHDNFNEFIQATNF